MKNSERNRNGKAFEKLKVKNPEVLVENIKQDEDVLVDTRTGAYLGRAN